ncbi:hypothetical protein PENTCL1PPCAC_26314, partial [Pristionchus entomophagus]
FGASMGLLSLIYVLWIVFIPSATFIIQCTKGTYRGRRRRANSSMENGGRSPLQVEIARAGSPKKGSSVESAEELHRQRNAVLAQETLIEYLDNGFPIVHPRPLLDYDTVQFAFNYDAAKIAEWEALIVEMQAHEIRYETHFWHSIAGWKLREEVDANQNTSMTEEIRKFVLSKSEERGGQYNANDVVDTIKKIENMLEEIDLMGLILPAVFYSIHSPSIDPSLSEPRPFSCPLNRCT